MDENPRSNSRGEWAALIFAILYPTLLTLVYFIWTASVSKAAQQTSYFLGKAIQFGFPLIWVGWVRHERLRWPRFSGKGVAAGIAFGLTISAGICGLYFGWFKAAGTFSEPARTMSEHLSGIGITNPAAYATMALFYSLIHSLLEEYYWRWFVFGRMRRQVSVPTAIGASSLAFMGHHIVVLGLYFGWGNPWTWLFSAATAVGGAFWAWLFDRSGSIYGPWFSHLLIDAAIFGVGYDLMQTATTTSFAQFVLGRNF